MNVVFLIYIGFHTPVICARLRAEGLTHFSDLKSMKEKVIRDIVESFSKRTANDGRYLFGIHCTRLLIQLVHWVQDFVHVNENPAIYEFIGEADAF